MFELTRTMSYVIPVMLSVLVAKTVADALEPKGIYDLVIECVIVLNLVLFAADQDTIRSSVTYSRLSRTQAVSTALSGLQARIPMGCFTGL
jgi:hypothetical protein